MKIFDTIQVKTPPSSVFDLSRENKLSCNMAEMVPIMVEEVLPGDTFKVNTEIMIRLAPMLAPVMHRVHVWTHSFYVPNRLVWDNWHDHITGGDDGNANPAFPTIRIKEANKAQFAKGTLADYLGVPSIASGTTLTNDYTISALPFRAYQLIYDEYYRDQDLIQKIDVSTGDGEVSDAELTKLTEMRYRAWEKDYFTSSRPSSQKGSEVVLPTDINYKFPTRILDNNGNPIDATPSVNTDGYIGSKTTTGQLGIELNGTAPSDFETQFALDNIEDIGVSIRDLRNSNKLQEWLELAMRGGSRINEVIRNFFGVVPDDLRLTRPQYLGGSKQNVVFSEVLNTAGDAGGQTLQALGDYGGHGVSVGNQAGFKKSFKEHGYVLTLMSILPVTGYSQGLHRHWRKFDKYQRYWPQFANIGEQEVVRDEVYMDWSAGNSNNTQTFGYSPRYAEYKYACNEVHGDFRKEGATDNLSYWHMARHFATAPVLDGTFVTANPTERIFAVQDQGATDKLYCQIYHNVKARRKMAYHATPSLV